MELQMRFYLIGEQGTWCVYPNEDNAPKYFFEDQCYSFRLECAHSSAKPILLIGSYEYEPSHSSMSGSSVVWYWDNSKYFENAFGWTKLALDFENIEVFNLPPVEVVTSKLKAEQTKSMLDYLYRVEPRILYACFARTGAPLSAGRNAPTLQSVINAAEAAISAVERLVFPSFRRIKTRLKESISFGPPKAGQILDDRLLYNILEGLSPSQNHVNAVPLRLLGRTVYLNRLASVSKYESTDIYENSIVLGLLYSVSRTLAQLTSTLEATLNEIAKGAREYNIDVKSGFVRFHSICGYYVHSFSKEELTIINELMGRLKQCQERANAVIPAKPRVAAPRPTPVFLSYEKYHAIYSAAHNWYDLGEEVVSSSVVFMGLRTIDRLYEFVCLFKLLELLQAYGWEIVESRSSHLPSLIRGAINNEFCLRHKRLGSVELLYEPQIPPINSGDTLWGLSKVAEASGRSYQPDFILRWMDPKGKVRSKAVFDAKFSRFRTMKDRYLASTTLKYLFGVRDIDDYRKQPFEHLWLLGPTENEMHNYQKQLERTAGIKPSIGIIGVLAEEEVNGLHKWYHSFFRAD